LVGDPDLSNQKTRTALLLKPNGEFDSFGFVARDRYHDLRPSEALQYLFFEKFKMVLHHDMVSFLAVRRNEALRDNNKN
jgi:hypothetical protein